MIGTILLLTGLVLLATGVLWLLWLAFQEGLAIFLATLLVPLFGLYTLLRTWPTSRFSLFLQVGGVVLAAIGAQLTPYSLVPSRAEQPEIIWSEKRNVRGGPTIGGAIGRDDSEDDARNSLRKDPQESLPVAPPTTVVTDPTPPPQDSDSESGDRAAPSPPADPARAAVPSDAATGSSDSYPAPPPTNPSMRPRPTGRDLETIALGRLGEYVNRYVTIEVVDGERIQGTIERIDAEAVILRRRIGGGTISFRIERSNIRSARARRRSN